MTRLKIHRNPSKTQPIDLTKYSTINSLRVQRIYKKDIIVLKQALEEIWTKNNFPENYKSAFRNLLEKQNIYKAAGTIVSEMESIETGTESIQLLKKSTINCEILLKKLYSVTSNKDTSKVVSLLQALRDETYKGISRLKVWRSKLQDN